MISKSQPIRFRKPMLYLAFICAALTQSCTKKFPELNRDKNSISSVGPTEFPYLFSKAQTTAPGNQINYQTAQNLFADQYAQYFACVVDYFPTDRLEMMPSWSKDAFTPMYTGVLPQLKAILDNSQPSSPQNALAQIWWVYTFHRVTDYWGPIPYFNAGQASASVAYDAQDKIYDDFFKRLDGAVTALKATAATNVFGNFDLVYAGSVDKWIKLANSLRLRLAVRISKVDATRAKTEAEKAFASGVMTSTADDAFVKRFDFNYDGNGLSWMTDWGEFRMSASMESVLKGYNDPRISRFFIPAVSTGQFDGLRNGLKESDMNKHLTAGDDNSHVGPSWAGPAEGGLASFMTTPQLIMCAAEVYFLRAEGAMLGWNMGGTAKEMYEQGITESLKQWGITNTTTISNYVNGVSTPVAPNDYLSSPAMTNIPVKFSAVAGEQKEQIATQKWLALFPDGMEAWADYRRSRALKLYPVANSDNPDITNTSTQWIRRLTFLDTEKLVNGDAVEKAIGLLGGPDKITTPLWWDKN